LFVLKGTEKNGPASSFVNSKGGDAPGGGKRRENPNVKNGESKRGGAGHEVGRGKCGVTQEIVGERM